MQLKKLFYINKTVITCWKNSNSLYIQFESTQIIISNNIQFYSELMHDEMDEKNLARILDDYESKLVGANRKYILFLN